jgi:hypothetical protein
MLRSQPRSLQFVLFLLVGGLAGGWAKIIDSLVGSLQQVNVRTQRWDAGAFDGYWICFGRNVVAGNRHCMTQPFHVCTINISASRRQTKGKKTSRTTPQEASKNNK